MVPRPLELLIDGECPFCGREAALLRRLDRKRGNLRIVDISAPAFSAATYGKTNEQLRALLHARTPDGEIVTGLNAVHLAYTAVGWGFLYAPTRWTLLRPLSDWCYTIYARNRPLLRTWFDPCQGDHCATKASDSRPM